MRPWTLLRISLAICWLTTLVYVTIPDYGRQYTLFENLAYDPTGWLHECFYITTFFVLTINLTYYWENKHEGRTHLDYKQEAPPGNSGGAAKGLVFRRVKRRDRP